MSSERTIYWDACIFYEWLGNENVSKEKSGGLKEVITENEIGGNIIITSVATHLEVLPQKLEAKDPAAEEKYLALFDAEKFFEIQISTNTILLAREIRDFYYRPPVPEVPAVKAVAGRSFVPAVEYQVATSTTPEIEAKPEIPAVDKVEGQPAIPAKSAKMMDLGDCIHLATAIIQDAKEFHTRDNDDKGMKIPLLRLYDFSGVDSVCGKYPLKILSPLAIQGTLDVDP